MYNKKHNTNKGVHFTMGPVWFNQFNQFAKHGVNALRLFQFIHTKEGLDPNNRNSFRNPDFKHKFVKVDNKKLYEWFGVGRSKKWLVINKLANAGLIEVKKNGSGRAPEVKILVPRIH